VARFLLVATLIEWKLDAMEGGRPALELRGTSRERGSPAEASGLGA
jgi:hypothetical protein